MLGSLKDGVETPLIKFLQIAGQVPEADTRRSGSNEKNKKKQKKKKQGNTSHGLSMRLFPIHSPFALDTIFFFLSCTSAADFTNTSCTKKLITTLSPLATVGTLLAQVRHF